MVGESHGFESGALITRTGIGAKIWGYILCLRKEIDRQKQKAVAAMERLERAKKWVGIID